MLSDIKQETIRLFGTNESIKGDINLLNENTLSSFEKLCGLKIKN